MVEKHYKTLVGTKTTLDGAKYNDNSPVEYTLTGQAEVFIENWENIPTLTKTAITTALASDLFTEVT